MLNLCILSMEENLVVSNDNPHAMMIAVLFASPIFLQVLNVIYELQHIDESFTWMNDLWPRWMIKRGFHALHRNIWTLKELLVGKKPCLDDCLECGRPNKAKRSKSSCFSIWRCWRTLGALSNLFCEGKWISDCSNELQRKSFTLDDHGGDLAHCPLNSILPNVTNKSSKENPMSMVHAIPIWWA